jgi:hypothetical protein
MKNYLLIALAATTMLAAGCGNKSPGQAAQDLKNKVTGQSNDARNAEGFAGDWTTACEPYSIIPGLKSTKTQYHFGDNHDLTRKAFIYTGDKCQPESESFVRAENGNYSSTDKTTPKEGINATLNYITVFVTASTPDAVTLLNSLHYCEATNYTLKTGVNVTTHSDDKLLCLGVTKTPRSVQDTLKINNDGQLLVGSETGKVFIKN